MRKLANVVTRSELSAMWATLPLRVCGFALVLSFVAPSMRGMPIGDRQLGQLVPTSVVNFLDAAATFSLLATLGLALVWALRSVRSIRRSQPILLAVGLLAIGVAIGAARGILGDSEPRHALSHGQFVVPYVVALGLPIATPIEWRRLLFALRVGFTLPGVYSLFLLMVNGGRQPEWYTRIIPNGISFCGVACLLWLAHARHTGRRRYYTLAALCAVGVVVSGARAWILALAITLVLYLWMTRDWRLPVRRRFAVLVALAVVVASAAMAKLGTIESVITRTSRDFSGTSNLRVRQARILFDEWADSPFFGSGLGYRNPELARDSRPFEAARPYLVELSYPNLVAKMGLVGFGLLAAGMAVALWYLWTVARSSGPDATMAAMFAATVYLLLSSLVNPTFESVYLHFFIAIALVGSLSYVQQRPETASWSISDQ